MRFKCTHTDKETINVFQQKNCFSVKFNSSAPVTDSIQSVLSNSEDFEFKNF
jgi:hypothetical protein